MSGIRGAARKGKVKVRVRVRHMDTAREFTSNVFARKADSKELIDSVVERITAKHGAEYVVLKLRTLDSKVVVDFVPWSEK